MVKVEQFDMPFVNDLPKREQSRWSKIWTQLCEFKDLTDKHGALLPLPFAAKVAGVSRQRMAELCDNDQVARVYFHGHAYIVEDSFLSWARSERKAGRPLKLIDDAERKGDFRAALDMSVEFARECTKKTRK